MTEELEEINLEEEEQQSQKPDYKKRRQEQKESKVSLKQELLQTGIYLLIVLCLTFLIVNYVGQRTRVKGESMLPTLQHGDNLIVDKLTYRFSDPKRFDIIVFPHYDMDGTKSHYIKRIIGLPGETVRMDTDGTIYINGEVLSEDYGEKVVSNPGRAYTEITLGDDEYFVLGDNRDNSSDSRDPSVGNIHRADIVGKAWLRIWPLSSFGLLKHQ